LLGNLRVKSTRLLDRLIGFLRPFIDILLQTNWEQCKSVASSSDVMLLVSKLSPHCITGVKYNTFQFFVIQMFIIASW